MTEFQKIWIGLLGLTHPEMFIPRPKASPTKATKIESADGRGSTESPNPAEARGACVMRELKFMVAALTIGSRTVPLGDNSELLRDLSARARLLYDLDKG
jgi:hypothetical protein